jgi:hypothetical protein
MGQLSLTLTLILFSTTIFCQTQFWVDNFEAAAPSSGTRTPSYTGTFGAIPYTRYFARVTVADINDQAPGFAGIQGTMCWAAEDVDAIPTGVANAQSPEQDVTWTGINISGRVGLSFQGAFATTLATVWDHGISTTIADYCVVEYRIDAGAWTNLIAFRPNSPDMANGALAIDSNLDGLGDGTALTNTFTNFTASIPGSGTTFSLRCRFSSNSLAEEVAIDNFRLFNVTSLPVELTSFSSKCEGTEEKINWASETEKDFDTYTLERSTDGELFERIADIEPKGAPDKPASYEVLLPGTENTVYYRLKMTDLNGTFRYSWIIASENCLEERKLLQSFVVEEDRLTCFFSAPRMRYELLSISGIPVIQGTDSGSDTKHVTPLSVRSGVYLLQVTNDLGTQREVYRIFVP